MSLFRHLCTVYFSTVGDGVQAVRSILLQLLLRLGLPWGAKGKIFVSPATLNTAKIQSPRWMTSWPACPPCVSHTSRGQRRPNQRSKTCRSCCRPSSNSSARLPHRRQLQLRPPLQPPPLRRQPPPLLLPQPLLQLQLQLLLLPRQLKLLKKNSGAVSWGAYLLSAF